VENLPNRRTVRLEISHMGGILMGKYLFEFAGSEVYLPANALDNDSEKCSTALSTLKSVVSVNCTRESYSPETGAGSYLISLLSYPEKPFMNNIKHHDGNPDISLFSCDTSKVDAEEAQRPYCLVSDAEPTSDFPGK
jgi:hypothetical protein